MILLQLLDVFLQLGRVARGKIGLDVLHIGLELLTGRTLLAIVAPQGLAGLGQVALILLNLLGLLLGGGTGRF